MAQCSFIKADRKRCHANCVSGSRFCFFHDPDTREQHRAATIAGGRERNKPSVTLPPETPPLPLKSVADVTTALAEAYNLVRCGRLAVSVGNCLAVLAQSLMKAIEGSDLECRLEALENRHSSPHRRSA